MQCKPSREYKLQNEYKYIIIPLIMFTYTWVSIPPYHNRLNAFCWPLLGSICIWLWSRIFTSPYKIIVENNKIHFFTLLSKRTESISQIKCIHNGRFFIVLDLGKTNIWVSTLLDNISSIKLLNKSTCEFEDEYSSPIYKNHFITGTIILIISYWWYEFYI